MVRQKTIKLKMDDGEVTIRRISAKALRRAADAATEARKSQLDDDGSEEEFDLDKFERYKKLQETRTIEEEDDEHYSSYDRFCTTKVGVIEVNRSGQKERLVFSGDDVIYQVNGQQVSTVEVDGELVTPESWEQLLGEEDYELVHRAVCDLTKLPPSVKKG